ncbi:MAG: UDP-N-acetylmuramate dehydrogenase [Melioribacteraceae bacterium]|nr:UDP-N-acetylmuramate dehydrogenase [Melioribacteraceae bacterium]
MVEIKENISLKLFNTFRIDAKTKFFAEVNNEDELISILNNDKYDDVDKLILGGGSNILFLNDFQGLIIYNNIKGVEEKHIFDKQVLLKLGAGENWDEIVQYAVSKNYGGIENLSLIPGSVGAAPVQNIGAYGVELESVFHSLEGYYIHNKENKIFTKNECQFGYRNSIFKNRLNNKFIITRVNLLLQKNPTVNLSYASLNSVFETPISKLTIENVREKVIQIRQSKLPDPEVLSNAGSFFKNPEN